MDVVAVSTTPLPIRIPCEGSNADAHGFAKTDGGMCPMCGGIVSCRSDGTTWPHERDDRGDYDEAAT